ncbi:MAG: CehA/McbA family metallohydrolase [Chloroflexota bacterium]|nr:CehA/McbA family metallohydrolase [Chloroflexota bacterium]
MALSTPLDLTNVRNASRLEDVSSWDGPVAQHLEMLPEGEQDFWGIPFTLGAAHTPESWILLSEDDVTVPVGRSDITYFVFAHFCDAEPGVTRQPGMSGMVTNPGEVLASYTLRYANGEEDLQSIRRRFEINSTVAWGQLAFAARPQGGTDPVDINGPYPRGSWGHWQTGLQMARARTASNYWIYALPNPHPGRTVESLRLAAANSVNVVVAGITLFSGKHHPLRHKQLESFRIVLSSEPGDSSPEATPVSVDLGTLARKYAVPAFDPETWLADEAPGLGEVDGDAAKSLIVDVTASPDATLDVAGHAVPMESLYNTGKSKSSDGRVHVEVLTPERTWVHVRLEDAESSKPTAARVHFRAPDGRYFPPYGHRHEVNDNWFEDYAGDLKLGNTQYAYVDGTFQIELPVGDVYVEIFKGFEYQPLRKRLTIAPGQRELTLKLARPLNWRAHGWVTADTHVHFISPQTAWLEGQAEGVNLINLLASQWGDLYTNVADITGEVSGVSTDDTVVYVGTENRQHLLGHISLLGVQGEPIYPMTTAGPGESYIGDPVLSSMSEWADRARERDGLVVIPHFPNPYTEAVAEIVLGKVDAVELKYFTPSIDGFGLHEWYRFLNNGYRVAAVGGTDKMSAGIPVGGVRTYALLQDEFSFGTWADAVRGGRTFTTSGPLIDVRVEGKHPGDELKLPSGGGTLTVEAWAESVLPFHELQLVCNGAVVATQTVPGGGKSCRLSQAVKLEGSGWIAARCVSSLEVQHYWVVNVAAHTSPVYIVADNQELFNPSDATYMMTILDGGLTWLDTLATRGDAERHAGARQVFEHAKAHLQGRLHSHGNEH